MKFRGVIRELECLAIEASMRARDGEWPSFATGWDFVCSRSGTAWWTLRAPGGEATVLWAASECRWAYSAGVAGVLICGLSEPGAALSDAMADAEASLAAAAQGAAA